MDNHAEIENIGEVPAPSDVPAPSGWQYFFGVLVGIPSDAFFHSLAFDVLVKLKFIVLADEFENTYSNEGPHRAEIWVVFIALALIFFALTRWRRYSRFAWTAFFCHFVAGGLFTILMLFEMAIKELD